MFTNKKESLFEAPKTKESSVVTGGFLDSSMRTEMTVSHEGSVKHRTTGDVLIDQFASASKYRELRTYNEIATDMIRAWGQSPLLAVKFTLYLRMITRKVSLMDGSTTEQVQKGQGLKHESIMRYIWLHINHPEVFAKNIDLIIGVGSWKDLIQMMQYDAVYNGTDKKLDWDFLINVIGIGLQSNQSELVKKYLPTIRAKSKCKTVEAQANNIIGKAITKALFGPKNDANPGHTFAKYRRLKASGTAHDWQQAISQKRFKDIDFNTVAGRALQKLTNSKFLENQKMVDEYTEWILAQPVAKFTGYVYELFGPIENTQDIPIHRKHTINKQFETLLEQAKVKSKERFLPVIDTSGSMAAKATGLNIEALTVAKTMTLFFSELLENEFYGHYYEFSDTTIHRIFSGETYVDKFKGMTSSIIGGTQFGSIAVKLVQALRQAGSEDGFPTGIVAFSDGEFHRTSGGWHRVNAEPRDTEARKFRDTLLNGGFSKEYVENFKIVLWDIPNNYYGESSSSFEAYKDEPNTFLVGGLDPSIISFLLGEEDQEKPKAAPKNTEELFNAAMDQEILNRVEL